MQFILKLFAMNLLLFYFIIQGGSTDSEYLYISNIRLTRQVPFRGMPIIDFTLLAFYQISVFSFNQDILFKRIMRDQKKDMILYNCNVWKAIS